MSIPGLYTYNWNTGNYSNNYGEVVAWNEVFVNYVVPNSSGAYYLNNQNQERNTRHNQSTLKQPAQNTNLLANLKNVLFNKSGMMFNGTLEDVLGLDDNPDQLTSEDLCKVFLQSFQEYYNLFAQGKLVYYGPEELGLIVEWILFNSELYPDSKYFDQFPSLRYSSAIINTLAIYNPINQAVDPYFYPNPPEFEINSKEGYPYFSYSSYSTGLEYLLFPPIPTNINGNEYLFRIQWRIPNALF